MIPNLCSYKHDHNFLLQMSVIIALSHRFLLCITLHFNFAVLIGIVYVLTFSDINIIIRNISYPLFFISNCCLKRLFLLAFIRSALSNLLSMASFYNVSDKLSISSYYMLTQYELSSSSRLLLYKLSEYFCGKKCRDQQSCIHNCSNRPYHFISSLIYSSDQISFISRSFYCISTPWELSLFYHSSDQIYLITSCYIQYNISLQPYFSHLQCLRPFLIIWSVLSSSCC